MTAGKVKTNYYAFVGMGLGILSTFLLQTPVIPLLSLVALIISTIGVFEAQKTKAGLAYAMVGSILGIFVTVYYFVPF